MMTLGSFALALLHGDGDFSWTRWELHPSVLIGSTLFAGLYLLGVGPLRKRFGWADAVEPFRIVSFLAGCAILVLALNGPLHDLSDNYLFSAHMVQHMLITLLVPPLWLAGVPDWLVRPALQSRPIYATARFLTHPATAFAAYNAIYIGWHFPALYNGALERHGLHVVQHLMFIAGAVMMWWPLINPSPELERLTSPTKMLYLFAFGIPMSVVAAFITMASDALYPWYEAAPRIFPLDAVEDQQLGGAIMWVPGMIIYWTAVTVTFLRWAARERRQDERDRLAAASR